MIVALAAKVAVGGRPEIDFGTIQPGQMPDIFGDRMLERTRVTASLDGDGNVLLNARGAVQLPIDGSPDAILTELSINLGSGTVVGRGHVNNLPGVSSIGFVGNLISEQGTARVSILGWTSQPIQVPLKKDQ